MIMDRDKAKAAFEEYTNRYDSTEIRVRLKIDHTYRVADIAERIAKSIAADADLAWLLGLLHDIGRFEQLKRYGTFKDAESVDHAELGADILFGEEMLMRAFPGFTHDGYEKIAETAIRAHNKLVIPEGLDETTVMYCNILRDADKIDIFRVLTEPPYDERNKLVDTLTAPAREEVMEYVRAHRCLPGKMEKNMFENWIAKCCFAFELVYDESIAITREQGYFDVIFKHDMKDMRLKAQYDELEKELAKKMKIKY